MSKEIGLEPSLPARTGDVLRRFKAEEPGPRLEVAVSQGHLLRPFGCFCFFFCVGFGVFLYSGLEELAKGMITLSSL